MKNNPSEGSVQTHIFTSFPDNHQEEENLNLNLNEETNLVEDNFLPEKAYSIWQIEYYQKYFNVSTSDVVSRMIGSMIPTFSQSSLLNKIRPNPDLYGPFWISTTLIFTIAIGGNFVSFMSNFGSNFKWQTDFHKVTSSALAIVLYSWLVPAILYIVMRWRQTRAEFEFIEVLCIYGYSLSIYIPISILWLIHVSFVQWLLVIIAIVLSGSVLFITFWPVFNQDENKKIAFLVMASIVVLHALLGIGFMMYFFHYPSSGNGVTTINPVSTTTSFHTTVSNLNSSSITTN